MIYTLLLEPYRLPKIIPIIITILRGPRRMRFSRHLRKYYQDFAPRLWAILQRLGYRKFLQRFYIEIESDISITHQLYEFPILLAILYSLRQIQIPGSIVTLGKISSELRIDLPTELSAKLTDQLCGTCYLPRSGIVLHEALNKISSLKFEKTGLRQNRLPPKLTVLESKQKLTLQILPPLYKALLPGIVFFNEFIDLTATPVTILKKIDTEFIKSLPFIWKSTKELPTEKLYNWLILNRENLNLTVITENNIKKEREEFFSPLFT